MAEVMKLAPYILSFEGGFVNDPDDRGGATNKGVTIATWRKVGYDKDGDGDIDVDDLIAVRMVSRYRSACWVSRWMVWLVPRPLPPSMPPTIRPSLRN